MSIQKQPNYLSAAYNAIDIVFTNSSFEYKLAELVIRNYDEDKSSVIKRLNIYSDNTTRYNIQDIISSNIERIKQSYTFHHNQIALVDQVLAYLFIYDTDSGVPPVILDWNFAFNGVLDRNENIDFDPDELLNKPLLSNRQQFLDTERGHLNIFNGEYSIDKKHTYEYINILNDKYSTNNGTTFYKVDDIITSSFDLNVYDGYLYSWYLASLNDTGTYAIVNYNQPDGNNSWRVPDNDDWIELREFICPAIAGSGLFGGNNNIDNNAGLFLKGDSIWTSNVGENTYKFNAFPTGLRTFLPTTDFYGGYVGTNQNTRAAYISLTEVDTDNCWIPQLDSANQYLNIFGSNQNNKHWGYSVRLVRDAVPGDVDFNPEGYVGNNGVIYPTVKIGNQVWLAINLTETRWSINGYNNLYKPTNLLWESAFEKYSVYNITSEDSMCIDDDFFSFPCSMGDMIYGDLKQVPIENTVIINPAQITNKLYRYINQGYESSEYFPTSILHQFNVNSENLISTENGFNKMISNPIYPGSMKNPIGFILDEPNLSIQVNDSTRFKVGDPIVFRFEEMDTQNFLKDILLNEVNLISQIDGNIIRTNRSIVFSSGYDMSQFKVVVLRAAFDTLLLELNRTIITGQIGYINRTVGDQTEKVLVIQFTGDDRNKVLPYSFLQLLTIDQSLINVFGDLKVKLAGYSTLGATTTYFTTKIVDTDLQDWLEDVGNNRLVDFIQPNSIVYDFTIDYNSQYDVFTSKWLENNDIDDPNIYEKFLSEYTNFTKYDKCGRSEIIQLGYLNKWGAVEYLLFNKKRIDLREIERRSMRKPLEVGNRNKYDEELYNYNTKIEYDTTLYSDWLNEYEYSRCMDLLESTKVFEVKDSSQYLEELPIVITNTEVVERNINNDKLFNVELTFRRTYNKIMQR